MTTKQGKVEFDRIELGLGNCREELRGIPALAASITEQGLINPLTVRHVRIGGHGKPHKLPDGRKVHDRYILTAGNRRHAAIALIREKDRKAFEMVPVMLQEGNEEDALFIQLAENIDRDELTPMEIATAIERLLNRNVSRDEIAKRIGRTTSWISRIMKVRTKCTGEVRRALQAEKISFDMAVTLADLDEPAQVEALEAYTASGATPEVKRTVRATANRAANRIVRASAADLRTHVEIAESSRSAHGEAIAKALRWALGEGPFPLSAGK